MPRRHFSNVMIARIRVLGWSGDDVMKRIHEVIEGSAKVADDKGSFDWVFGDAEDIVVGENETVYFGRLGKVRHGLLETFYNEQKRKFVKKQLSLHRAAYSNFIVYPKRHLVVFEERRPYISMNQFITYFGRLYTTTFNDISSIKIEPLSESVQVRKMIRGFERVVEVEFDVVTSNPEDEEEFRVLDNLLKDAKSAASKMKLRNEGGLNVDSEIIRGGLALGTAGYGGFTVKGVKGGTRQTVKSRDQIIRLCIEVADDPVTLAREFFRELLKKLKE